MRVVLLGAKDRPQQIAWAGRGAESLGEVGHAPDGALGEPVAGRDPLSGEPFSRTRFGIAPGGGNGEGGRPLLDCGPGGVTDAGAKASATTPSCGRGA
jgi:hypothetical protein